MLTHYHPSHVEATYIVSKEKPRSGNYPAGSYISSSALRQEFFTEEEQLAQNSHLTRSMPFLYNLIRNKIEKDISEVETEDKDEEQEESNLADSFAEVEAGMADVVIDHLQDVSLLLCQSQPDKSNIKRDIITTVLRPINMTNNI
jgi:hypothetical protein